MSTGTTIALIKALGGGGGSGGGVVTITVTGSSSPYTADVSYADARAAYEAGKDVRLVYNENVYNLAAVGSSSLAFARVSVESSSNDVFSKRFVYSSGNGISVYTSQITVPQLVTVWLTENGSGSYVADTPFQEISVAYDFGRPVHICLTDNSEVTHYCGVINVKYWLSGEEDPMYSISFILNGSIVTLSGGEYDYPTYTP